MPMANLSSFWWWWWWWWWWRRRRVYVCVCVCVCVCVWWLVVCEWLCLCVVCEWLCVCRGCVWVRCGGGGLCLSVWLCVCVYGVCVRVYIYPSFPTADILSSKCRFHNQDGREQPCHGLGAKLFTMPIGWSSTNLWKHSQGNDVYTDITPEPRHFLHGRNTLKKYRREKEGWSEVKKFYEL